MDRARHDERKLVEHDVECDLVARGVVGCGAEIVAIRIALAEHDEIEAGAEADRNFLACPAQGSLRAQCGPRLSRPARGRPRAS